MHAITTHYLSREAALTAAWCGYLEQIEKFYALATDFEPMSSTSLDELLESHVGTVAAVAQVPQRFVAECHSRLYEEKPFESPSNLSHNIAQDSEMVEGLQNAQILRGSDYRAKVALADRLFSRSVTNNPWSESHPNLSSSLQERLIRSLLRCSPHVYSVCLFTGATKDSDDVLSILSNLSHPLASVHMSLSGTGREAFVRLLYGHESWWNEAQRSGFADRIVDNGVVVYFTYDNHHRGPRALKDALRNCFKTVRQLREATPHIHVTDTQKEARWIAEICLHPLGRTWLKAVPQQFSFRTSVMLREWKIEMSVRNDFSCHAIDSGAALALWGVRDAADLDFVSVGVTDKPIVNPVFDCHNEQYFDLGIETFTRIFDDNKYIEYKDIKFLSLEAILEFKRQRLQNAPNAKDEADVELITQKMYLFPVDFGTVSLSHLPQHHDISLDRRCVQVSSDSSTDQSLLESLDPRRRFALRNRLRGICATVWMVKVGRHILSRVAFHVSSSDTRDKERFPLD